MEESLQRGADPRYVKGRGIEFALPTLPLAQDPSVRVQRANTAGSCREARYTENS